MFLPGSKRQVLIPPTPASPRNGEGSAIRLANGGVFLAYSRFTGGGADHDRAELVGARLDVRTGHLTDARVLVPSPEAMNQMSASLEPLADGSWGLLWIRKLTRAADVLLFSRSGDEGRTWTAPVQVTRELAEPYVVVNNDRRGWTFGDNGAQSGRPWGWRTPLSVAVSDDHGARWRVLGDLEDDPHNYCYASILFLDGEALLTYYESENLVRDGKPVRRNLAALKMQRLDLRALA